MVVGEKQCDGYIQTDGLGAEGLRAGKSDVDTDVWRDVDVGSTKETGFCKAFFILTGILS